jgi:hypothetical protein
VSPSFKTKGQIASKTMETVKPDSKLVKIYSLVGERAVLLPLNLGSKSPDWNEWQKTSFKDTQEPGYQRKLREARVRGGNVGVLLGPASGGVVANRHRH